MNDHRLPYLYSVLRLVPDLDRGECVNIGLVMFSRPHRFLRVDSALSDRRIHAFAPGIDTAQVAEQLESLARIAAADPAGGPVAALDIGERFHWLSNTSNTMIQPGAVHSGLTDDAEHTFARLFAKLVAAPVREP